MESKINCRNARFKTEFNVGARLVRNFEGEALFNFGEIHDTKYSFVFGIGCVLGISHSEKFDVVTINFGRRIRKVICDTNHPRRQVYTLKVGQFANVLGVFKRWKHYDKENGKWKWEYIMFARALQGWYVPKQFDMEQGNDNIREMSEEDICETQNILDNLEITK